MQDINKGVGTLLEYSILKLDRKKGSSNIFQTTTPGVKNKTNHNKHFKHSRI